MTDDHTPIVIGVGDYVNRSLRVEDALEPAELIIRAVENAITDATSDPRTQATVRRQFDSISVVRTWTWPYPDLPGLIASKLGSKPSYTHYTEHGGNQSGKVFDEAARRVAQGRSKIAIVTGGEALASLSACIKAQKVPPPGWSRPNDTPNAVFSPTNRELKQGTLNTLLGDSWAADHTGGLGAVHGIGAPIHVYPLYENAYRAHYGQTIPENNKESADMYYDFARTAEQNPYAWNYKRCVKNAAAIGQVSKENRMICYPYPLLMNAFNTVNLAAACVLTTTEYARDIGIPESKWIYALGGAGTGDSSDFWHRANFHSSPAISKSIDAALNVSGLIKDEVDLYDFYSCFPIVPKLACRHLGLSTVNPKKPISLLGGLTSFGGAGNNYSMHALTAMVRELRRGRGRHGLVLANGGVVTYQHAVVLSSQKPRTRYPDQPPLQADSGHGSPRIDESAEGEAVIETYTVEFDRQGNPSRGHVVGRLKSNSHRFLANHADDMTLQQLASVTREPIGRVGYVRCKDGRNIFTFAVEPRL